MNRDNLKKLADHLAALPEGYKEFNMHSYFRLKPHIFSFMQSSGKQLLRAGEIGRNYATNKCSISECGAVACAVGHGPAAGIPFTSSEMAIYGDEEHPDWRKYTEANFCPVLNGSNDHSLVFLWMFGGRWVDVDNTPQGAAARIYYLLDGNDIPWTADEYGYTDVIMDSSVYQEYVK